MAGAILSQSPSLEYFPMPIQLPQRSPDLSNISPGYLYTPQADLSTDCATSPIGSPTSPVLTNPYQLPLGGDWVNWEEDKCSDVLFKTEAYEPDLSSIPARDFPDSPAVNPVSLMAVDQVSFGRGGLDDSQPLFQNPIPTKRQQTISSSSTLTTWKQPGPQIKSSPPTSPRISDPPSPRYPSRKRKSSPSASSAHTSPSPPPLPPSQRHHSGPHYHANAPKKTAHNMIEKRYRTNLNDKIAALRDSVPALRVMIHRVEAAQTTTATAGERGGAGAASSEEDTNMIVMMMQQGEEDLCGLAPAHKLNKATILSKATEYIAHLEKRNQKLARENAALLSRVEGFEMLVMSRGGVSGGVWN